VLEEARESYAPEKVVELQSNSVDDMDSNASRIEKWIEDWKTRKHTALGDYLTNEDASIRAKGTALLSLVLLECSREQVNPAAANANELVNFYHDRLADAPSVPQLLKGLVSLQQFKLFQSVKVQSLQQTDHYIVFQFFAGLLKRHLNGSFRGYFCYFPITFKPLPDDLKLMFFCHTTFFKSLLLEKLASSSSNAKKDSMEILAACAPVYGTNALTPYLEDLWDGLKIECLDQT
ncbi:2620_t:CDS:2, partial [Ambispora gerdemannii]